MTGYRKGIMKLLLLIIFLTSCNNNKTDQYDNKKQANMDTIRETSPSQSPIKGTAGEIYVDDGGSNGIPVVLVHSFGGNTTQWKTQLDFLRKSRRTIALDLRGHGNSAHPENNNYTVQGLASDIGAVADALNLEHFVLVGHSMGGSAAIDYAFRNPEKVRGLVLVGTPGKSSSTQSGPVIASLESAQYEKVMADYMERLTLNAKPQVKTEVMNGMRRISKEASITIIRNIFEYDPLPALSAYPGPKLIVSSTMEKENPAALSKQLPDIPHQEIPGTSHWIQMDKPEAFNTILDQFLKKVERELSK